MEISVANSNIHFSIAIKPLLRILFTQFPKLSLLFCGTGDWFQTYVREARTGGMCDGTAKFAAVRPSTAKYYLPQKEQIEWFFTPNFQNVS